MTCREREKRERENIERKITGGGKKTRLEKRENAAAAGARRERGMIKKRGGGRRSGEERREEARARWGVWTLHPAGRPGNKMEGNRGARGPMGEPS